jgi:hypothetical protein
MSIEGRYTAFAAVVVFTNFLGSQDGSRVLRLKHTRKEKAKQWGMKKRSKEWAKL